MAQSPIQGTTRLVGVLGYPVRHSASPAMHNAAFAALGLDWVYVPFEVAPENIGEAIHGIRALGMVGVNVTVPLKELVPPLMDTLTPRATVLKAVNTVIHRDDGQLVGDSTDGPGFLAALESEGVSVGPGTKAVVLGAGGSARAVVRALTEAGARVTVLNRNVERAETMVAGVAPAVQQVLPLEANAIAEALSGAHLLVNTTSLGMYPNIGEMPPVPVESLKPGLFVSDLIYNPAETQLLRAARKRGCRTQNGLEMLVQQGAISFRHWTGLDPPLVVMRQAVQNVLSARQSH